VGLSPATAGKTWLERAKGKTGVDFEMGRMEKAAHPVVFCMVTEIML